MRRAPHHPPVSRIPPPGYLCSARPQRRGRFEGVCPSLEGGSRALGWSSTCVPGVGPRRLGRVDRHTDGHRQRGRATGADRGRHRRDRSPAPGPGRAALHGATAAAPREARAAGSRRRASVPGGAAGGLGVARPAPDRRRGRSTHPGRRPALAVHRPRPAGRGHDLPGDPRGGRRHGGHRGRTAVPSDPRVRQPVVLPTDVRRPVGSRQHPSGRRCAVPRPGLHPAHRPGELPGLRAAARRRPRAPARPGPPPGRGRPGPRGVLRPARGGRQRPARSVARGPARGQRRPQRLVEVPAAGVLAAAGLGAFTAQPSTQFAAFFRLGCTRGGSPGIFG